MKCQVLYFLKNGKTSKKPSTAVVTGALRVYITETAD